MEIVYTHSLSVAKLLLSLWAFRKHCVLVFDEKGCVFFTHGNGMRMTYALPNAIMKTSCTLEAKRILMPFK